MKKVSSLFLALLLVLGMSGCSGGGGITIYDADGAVLAAPRKRNVEAHYLTDEGYSSYVSIVLEEAVSILATVHDCNSVTAERKLFRGGYTIHTVFDQTVYAAMANAYAPYAADELAFGCAITDYAGNLFAVYSGGDERYALDTRAPCSTIKPLSVYAPAIEQGVIDWSTKIEDRPYKKLPNETGQVANWPTNARGGYTYEKTGLYECIQQSLNTTAVHGLNLLGVAKSMKFLQDAFDVDLSYEQNRMAFDGADEVIGALAMGSLYKGFTPATLAGYYQIFGNGGLYERPHTISEIRDGNGEVIYTYAGEAKQVIGADTAYIMNQLLQSVVKPGGTGTEAQVSDVQLAGKTGTGDGDNWFVGITPEYSCAVWHGDVKEGNIADRLFSEVFSGMPEHTVTEFPVCADVRKAVCCSESGLQFSSSCRNMQIGYYAADRMPAVCDQH